MVILNKLKNLLKKEKSKSLTNITSKRKFSIIYSSDADKSSDTYELTQVHCIHIGSLMICNGV